MPLDVEQMTSDLKEIFKTPEELHKYIDTLEWVYKLWKEEESIRKYLPKLEALVPRKDRPDS